MAKTTIPQLQAQRRSLSAVLSDIIESSVRCDGGFECLVPAKLIRDARKVYGKIWRKG